MTIIRTIEGKPLDWFPGIYAETLGGGQLGVDPNGSLVTRGGVLTDEGSYRANFSGTSAFYEIGGCTFTNGSNVVTGSGFDSESIHHGDYVKLSTDSDSYLEQIERIISATELTLVSPYLGSSGTGICSVSKLEIKMGTGCSYSVANGNLSMNSGTISGSIMEIERFADYSPIIKQTSLNISQRNQNQTIVVGLYDDINTVSRYWCWFKFTGTDNNSLVCESAFNKNSAPTVYDIESTFVKLPTKLDTSLSIRYRIEALVDKVRFLVNGILVAEHFRSIPNPYASLTSTIRVINDNTVGVATVVNVDYDSLQNFNKVMSAPINDTDPPAATTNDMESLVNLLTQLVSRTCYPDPLGRNRVTIETSSASNMSVNTAQFGGNNVVTGNGVGGNGIPRVTLSNDSFTAGPQTSLGTTIPIIYNNIVITA